MICRRIFRSQVSKKRVHVTLRLVAAGKLRTQIKHDQVVQLNRALKEVVYAQALGSQLRELIGRFSKLLGRVCPARAVRGQEPFVWRVN